MNKSLKHSLLYGAIVAASSITPVMADPIVDCTGLPVWDASTSYNGGASVQQNGAAYSANWWTRGNDPETHSGNWQEWDRDGVCGSIGEAPVAQLTSPVNGATFDENQVIAIDATASDADGSVTLVEFFVDGTKIGEDATSPYSINWTTVGGNHVIEALATDDTSQTGSSSVNVTVTSSNVAPTVDLTNPTSSTDIFVDDLVSLTATAADSDGSVTKVEFYVDDALIGMATDSPYTVNWNAIGGAHTFKAIATDDKGASTISAEITVTVQGDLPSGCAGIEDYSAGTAYSDGQQVANNNRKYTCNIAGWCSSNAAWAYEPGVGTVWQDAWTDDGICSIAPTVAITAPADNSVILSGTETTIDAIASDDDGAVMSVEFFANDVSLGVDTTAPYSVNWVATGNAAVTLKATAIDNESNQTDATALVNVSEEPVVVSLTSPTSGSTVAVGNASTIAANATSVIGNVTSVEFSVNGAVVATDTTSPYSASWTPASAGNYTVSAKATDSTGAMATSAAATVTASTIQVQDHKLVGYWHNFVNGAGCPIRLRDISPAWDVVDIAFADNDRNSDGTVHFNLYAGDIRSTCLALDPQEFKDDVAYLQSKGKKIVLSLGGAEGTITLNTDTDEANFIASLTDIVAEWGFDGLDVDLESGSNLLHGTQIQARLGRALLQIEQNMGGDMYLTMAPEHPYVQGGWIAYSGIWGAYIPLINETRHTLDILHVQLYNNGGLANPYANGSSAIGSTDMMVASARMLIEGFELGNGEFFDGLRPDQVSLGLPSGPKAAGSGQATTKAITDALDCITRGTNCGSFDAGGVYPSFSGAMTWSINWDVYDGYIFSGPIGDHVHNLP